MGKRVQSGPRPPRQGGLHSTIVSCRGPMSHSTRTWSRACGDAPVAPAAHAGYVQLRQSGHQISFPGGG